MARSGKKPTVVCAWCQDILSHGHGAISHGICSNCEERVLQVAEEHWREGLHRYARTLAPVR